MATTESLSFYLDTNPLMRWAETLAPGSSTRACVIGQRVHDLIGSPAHVAVSEVTIAELLSNVHTYLRSSEKVEYDDAWMSDVYDRFMAWIGGRHIDVLPTPPHAYRSAITYLEMATREHGRALKAWDAVHIAIATQWARDSSHTVEIVTSDGSFLGFLEVFPAFREFISVVDLAIASPGE